MLFLQSVTNNSATTSCFVLMMHSNRLCFQQNPNNLPNSCFSYSFCFKGRISITSFSSSFIYMSNVATSFSYSFFPTRQRINKNMHNKATIINKYSLCLLKKKCCIYKKENKELYTLHSLNTYKSTDLFMHYSLYEVIPGKHKLLLYVVDVVTAHCRCGSYGRSLIILADGRGK